MNTSTDVVGIPVKQRSRVPLLLALSLPLALMLKMGFFFLILAMIPTLVTLALVPPGSKYTVSTIAAFNFAGLFPDLLSIIMQGGTPRAFYDRVADISAWCAAYGAAVLGIAIIWLSPSIAMLLLEGLYRGRLRHLEHLQKKLEEEWGTQVKGRQEQ